MKDGRINLALNRTAMQSSTCCASWHDDPGLDAAGGNNGMVTGYYSFCTGIEEQPWWMVDLGKITAIEEIVVYNRVDTTPNGAERSAHLRVSLSQDGYAWETIFAREDDAPFGGADGNPLRIDVDGRSARWVKLSLPSVNLLCLDEVEVY